jgi:hypothetical protein
MILERDKFNFVDTRLYMELSLSLSLWRISLSAPSMTPSFLK